MQKNKLEQIYAAVAKEANRTDYPEGFSLLPEVPVGRYSDPQFYHLEMQHLWPKSWLHAAHISEFPRQGSYKLFEQLGLSIIVNRGLDDKIRAFHNICRHRGSALLLEKTGTARRFACPYHGWGYSCEGKLDSVPEERNFPGLDKSSHGLIGVRCEIMRGAVFINVDADAQPLAEHLAFAEEEIGDFPFEEMVVKDEITVEMDCDWKTALDNFLEIYHVKTVHANSIAPYLDSKSCTIELYKNGHARLATAKRGETIFGSQLATSDHLGALFKDHNIAILRFPNAFSAIDPAGFAWQTWWPLGPRKTVMVLSVMGWKGDSEEEQVFWDGMREQMRSIAAEDQHLFAPLQRSLDSGYLPAVRMGYQERVLYWYQEEIDRRIGVEKIPEHLRMKPVLADQLSDQASISS